MIPDMIGMAIKRDFRKLALATQAELRRIAVAMVRAGKTRIEAAEAVGVNRRFVGRWVKAAAQRGEAALAGGGRCARGVFLFVCVCFCGGGAAGGGGGVDGGGGGGVVEPVSGRRLSAGL